MAKASAFFHSNFEVHFAPLGGSPEKIAELVANSVIRSAGGSLVAVEQLVRSGEPPTVALGMAGQITVTDKSGEGEPRDETFRVKLLACVGRAAFREFFARLYVFGPESMAAEAQAVAGNWVAGRANARYVEEMIRNACDLIEKVKPTLVVGQRVIAGPPEGLRSKPNYSPLRPDMIAAESPPIGIVDR